MAPNGLDGAQPARMSPFIVVNPTFHRLPARRDDSRRGGPRHASPLQRFPRRRAYDGRPVLYERKCVSQVDWENVPHGLTERYVFIGTLCRTFPTCLTSQM